MTDSIKQLKKQDSGCGTLYVVATPIGNLEDLTIRAARVLASADFIAAEDTRTTLKLLNHLGLKKPMISCYRHNEESRCDEIINRIKRGEDCALCSDAGTPAVSDPGEQLVRKAVDAGVRVSPVPGPSAVIAALSSGGMSTGRFCFEGFIPVNKKTRRLRLSSIENEPRTIVIYEAPHKLKNTLKDLLSALGDRELILAREMTKIHEEFIRTSISGAISLYKNTEPKGEYVLLIEGKVPDEIILPSLSDAAEAAKLLIGQGYSASAAAKGAAEQTGLSRSEIYKAVLDNADMD